MPNDSFLTKLSQNSCISIIGMPGVGKSTVGIALAKHIAFVPLDCDYVIESLYGVSLQDIADRLTKDGFLDLESEILQKLRVNRAVLATGGSVVYREKTMAHLKTLGPCVFMSAPLDLILDRIALNPDRGLAIGPNQTVQDLYDERMELYAKYADATVYVDKNSSPESIVNEIINLYR